MAPPDSDLGVYLVSGAFAILVFVVAMALLVTQTAVELTLRTAAMFSVGFLLFIGMYVAAMAIYRGIEAREDVK